MPEVTGGFTLTPEERASFHERGYFGPFKVYEIEEMQRRWRVERLRLMDRSNAVYQDEAAQSGNTNISNYDRHLDSQFLADHICRPEIVGRVAAPRGVGALGRRNA